MFSMIDSGGVQVVLTPEYDYKLEPKKIESTQRTRAGANYKYIWGRYSRITFSTEYVTSSDMCKVNSWWGANTPVTLYDTASVAVIVGNLANASAPIDHFMPPYSDKFGGTIELESF
jgi:hypothetical protein